MANNPDKPTDKSSRPRPSQGQAGSSGQGQDASLPKHDLRQGVTHMSTGPHGPPSRPPPHQVAGPASGRGGTGSSSATGPPLSQVIASGTGQHHIGRTPQIGSRPSTDSPRFSYGSPTPRIVAPATGQSHTSRPSTSSRGPPSGPPPHQVTGPAAGRGGTGSSSATGPPLSQVIASGTGQHHIGRTPQIGSRPSTDSSRFSYGSPTPRIVAPATGQGHASRPSSGSISSQGSRSGQQQPSGPGAAQGHTSRPLATSHGSPSGPPPQQLPGRATDQRQTGRQSITSQDSRSGYQQQTSGSGTAQGHTSRPSIGSVTSQGSRSGQQQTSGSGAAQGHASRPSTGSVTSQGSRSGQQQTSGPGAALGHTSRLSISSHGSPSGPPQQLPGRATDQRQTGRQSITSQGSRSGYQQPSGPGAAQGHASRLSTSSHGSPSGPPPQQLPGRVTDQRQTGRQSITSQGSQSGQQQTSGPGAAQGHTSRLSVSSRSGSSHQTQPSHTSTRPQGPSVPFRSLDLPRLTHSPRALVVKSKWAYNDTADYVTDTRMRGSIPDEFKVNGFLLFEAGNEGLHISTSPTGEWCKALFRRYDQMVTVFIPFNRVTIGKEYKDYATKIKESQEVHLEDFSAVNNGTPLEKLIRSFWTGMRAQRSALTQLGVDEGDATLMFSDANFRSNVNRITDAFTDEVKSVIKNGDVNAKRLSGLRKVSESWPPAGTKCIYLRLYTHQDPADANVEDFALYAGQSIQIQVRDYQHGKEMQTEHSHWHSHYSQARNSLPENRHMIPIMIFDEATSGALINMAEETAIMAFNCVNGMGYIDTLPDVQKLNLIKRAIAIEARQASLWPKLECSGCNVISPLTQLCGSPFYGISWPPQFPGDRGMTVYRRVGRLTVTGGAYAIHVGLYRESKLISARFLLDTARAHQAGLKKHSPGYIVFEIMHDGRPHERPWIRCPTAGTFKKFDSPSRLGVRFEWFDESANQWYSLSLHRQNYRRLYTRGVDNQDEFFALAPWHRTNDIIRALEGTRYHNPSGDFPETVSLGRKNVLMLELDHLNQTAAWVQRKGRTEAAPERASFEYNQGLIGNQCGPDTLTNRTKPPPDETDFWFSAGDEDVSNKGHQGHEKKKKCDLCTYMVTKPGTECAPARDLHNLPYYACRCCAMLNRYCTFTATANRERDWGRGPPFLLPENTTLARFPTGSHRHLSFYRVQDTERQRIDAPFEGENDLEAALKLAALDETEEEVADDGDEEYDDE